MTAKADTNPLREALELARRRIEYLGSYCNERHQKANEADFFPIIDAALASEPVAGTVTSTEIWNAAESLRSLGAWQARAANILHDEIVRLSAPPAPAAEDIGREAEELIANSRPAPAGREPTEAETNSVCMAFRHDFGLLPESNRQHERFIAREWLRAWQKEGYAIPPHAGATTASAPEPVAWQARDIKHGGAWVHVPSPRGNPDFEYRPLYATPPVPGAADRAAVTEECAKVAEGFKNYTGYGKEDVNDLIGMFARGNRSAKNSIAAAIRSLGSTLPRADGGVGS